MPIREPAAEGPFVPVAGMKLVFDPSARPDCSNKKHPCPDCHFCQFCSDARCQSCRGKCGASGQAVTRKLSLCEQVELYDRINAKEEPAS